MDLISNVVSQGPSLHCMQFGFRFENTLDMTKFSNPPKLGNHMTWRVQTLGESATILLLFLTCGNIFSTLT